MGSRRIFLVLAWVLLGWCGVVSLWADGKVFAARGIEVPVRTPDQRALIHFKEGVQRLVIETAFAAEGTNFAWVVPLPSEPKIEAVSTNFFPDLSRTFQAKLIHRPSYVWLVVLGVGAVIGITIWIGRNRRSYMVVWIGVVVAGLATSMFLPALSTASMSSGGTGSSTAPAILQRAQVGLYDTVVLRGTEGGRLLAWLHDNGFHIPEGALPVISSYASNNWVFAAARMIAPGDAEKVNRPHPLAFTFPAERAIYPLRLTGIENGSCEIELFVFGEKRAGAQHFRAEFCGEPNPIQKEGSPRVSWEAFALPRPGDFRIATDELKKFALPAPAVTKLVGKLRPAEMREDAEIAWEDYAPQVPTRYSFKAAATRSLDWGMGIIVTGALLFYANAGPGRFVIAGKRFKALALAGMAAGTIRFVGVEIVPVTTGYGTVVSRALGGNFEINLEILAEHSLTNGPIDFEKLKGAFEREKLEFRNAFTQEPIREEATPGNITFQSTKTNTVVRWYDINGVDYEMATFSSKTGGN